MRSWEKALEGADGPTRSLLERVPPQHTPPLPPDWLRWEMLERLHVLRFVPVREGSTLVEVGSGGQAIATVPMASLVGARGRVLAVERSRWTRFQSIVDATGMGDRVRMVTADARHLPFRSDAGELALCIHGVRSLGEDESVVAVLREMLRVAPMIAIAESLPAGDTDAQKAHLAMYTLRAELFQSLYGRADDLPYRSLDRLVELVRAAGGNLREAWSVDLDLPHAMAYFPRTLIEGMPEGPRRSELLARWDAAEAQRTRHGTDHPPVGVIVAARAV